MANLPLETVKKLYYAQKLTAQEVGENLGTTSSVVYKFMKRKRLPRRAIQESNRIRFEKSPLSFRIKTNRSPEEENLRIAGIMLYWGEGSRIRAKSNNWTVEFSNSNPRMIELFLRFLRRVCGIQEGKLRLHLYYYTNQNLDVLKTYWHKITGIPLPQFTRPYARDDFNLNKVDKMKYGMVHIRYSDKRLLLQVEKWIEEYIQKWVGSEADKRVAL